MSLKKNLMSLKKILCLFAFLAPLRETDFDELQSFPGSAMG
jgi:hypothetical protein